MPGYRAPSQRIGQSFRDPIKTLFLTLFPTWTRDPRLCTPDIERMAFRDAPFTPFFPVEAQNVAQRGFYYVVVEVTSNTPVVDLPMLYLHHHHIICNLPNMYEVTDGIINGIDSLDPQTVSCLSSYLRSRLLQSSRSAFKRLGARIVKPHPQPPTRPPLGRHNRLDHGWLFIKFISDMGICFSPITPQPLNV